MSNDTYFSINEIHVPEQYGASLKASQFIEGQGDKGEIQQFTEVEKESASGLSNKEVYFIKCPDSTLDYQVQAEFVTQEFKGGGAINFVSGPLMSDDKTAMKIVKLIGKGILVYRSESRPCLIYEYIGPKNINQPSDLGLLSESDEVNSLKFLLFARGLARAVQVLHNQGVVHSYLVPRNIINNKVGSDDHSPSERRKLSIDPAEWTIVGFGYARHADAAARQIGFSQAGIKARKPRESKLSDWSYLAPECRKTHTGSSFGYSSDIYSIGAILLALLLQQGVNKITKAQDEGNQQEIKRIFEIGVNILNNPPSDARILKKTVALCVQKLQPELFNENENILKIIDSCLRNDPNNRFSCVEELIETIDIALDSSPGKASGESDNRLSKQNVLGSLGDVLKNILVNYTNTRGESDNITSTTQTTDTDYFTNLKQSLAISLAQDYKCIERDHYEVYGHRDRIVTSLCRLLGSAKENHIYRTMTLPDYWTDSNLGSLGRFLTMNKHMARNGVRIQRIFLVNKDFHLLEEEEQVVLEDHLKAWEEIDPSKRENFVIKVLPVNDEEKILNFEKNGELVAYLAPSEYELNSGKFNNVICLNFFSTAREVRNNGQIALKRTIKKVRSWTPKNSSWREDRFKESSQEFIRTWDNQAISLHYFIHGKSESESKPIPGVEHLKTLLGKQ